MRPRLRTERGHARPVDASAPREVPEGKARCDCGRVLKVLKSGRLKAHLDPKGNECSGTVGNREVTMSELMEGKAEILALADQQPARQIHYVPGSRADEAYRAERGKCRECGKWLPGERTLCGACSVRLGR